MLPDKKEIFTILIDFYIINIPADINYNSVYYTKIPSYFSFQHDKLILLFYSHSCPYSTQNAQKQKVLALFAESKNSGTFNTFLHCSLLYGNSFNIFCHIPFSGIAGNSGISCHSICWQFSNCWQLQQQQMEMTTNYEYVSTHELFQKQLWTVTHTRTHTLPHTLHAYLH